MFRLFLNRFTFAFFSVAIASCNDKATFVGQTDQSTTHRASAEIENGLLALTIEVEKTDISVGEVTKVKAYSISKPQIKTDVTKSVKWEVADGTIFKLTDLDHVTGLKSGKSDLRGIYSGFSNAALITVRSVPQSTSQLSPSPSPSSNPSTTPSAIPTSRPSSQPTPTPIPTANPPLPPSVTVQSILISPTTATIASGSLQQFSATAVLSDGTRPLITESATWSTSPDQIAMVTKGLVFGVAKGSVSIFATYGGKSASAQVIVDADPSTLVLPTAQSGRLMRSCLSYKYGGTHNCNRAMFDVFIFGNKVGSINLNNYFPGSNQTSSGPGVEGGKFQGAWDGGGKFTLSTRCAVSDCHPDVSYLSLIGEVVDQYGSTRWLKINQGTIRPNTDYTYDITKFTLTSEPQEFGPFCGLYSKQNVSIRVKGLLGMWRLNAPMLDNRTGWNTMVSGNKNEGGEFGYNVVGNTPRFYLAENPTGAGAPLYRCMAGADHFESLDPLCEGQGAGAVLGYLAPGPVAGTCKLYGAYNVIRGFPYSEPYPRDHMTTANQSECLGGTCPRYYGYAWCDPTQSPFP